MKTKIFDCVEMKPRGAERSKEKIDRMTVQQKLEFWAERSKAFKRRQATAQAQMKPLGDAPLKAPAC